jgi:hypothetical protein
MTNIGHTVPSVGASQPHVVAKKEVGGIGATLLRIIKRIFASIAAIHGENLPHSTVDHPIGTNPSSDSGLRQQLRSAKEEERRSVLEAYQQVEAPDTFSCVDLQSEERIRGVCIATIARAIIRDGKRRGVTVRVSDAETAAGNLMGKTGSYDIDDVFVSSDFTLPKERAVFIWKSTIHNRTLAGTEIAKDYRAWCVDLEKVKKLLQSLAEKQLTGKQLCEANKEILRLLRRAIRSDVYQFLCHDETIPAISYLHRLVIASFVCPMPLRVYQGVGKRIVDGAVGNVLAQQGRAEVSPSLTEVPFPEVLRELRRSAVEQHLMASDATVEYVRTYPREAFSALQSATPLLGDYDPRMSENATGRLFTEQVTHRMEIGLSGQRVHTKERSVEILGVYSPSPTVGNSVSPEGEAFLQALENRQFMSADVLEAEPPFARQTHWTFMSLQNLDSRAEGSRAKAIMELNERYPLSFTGRSVSQDSEFYLDGLHGASERKIEQMMVKRGGNGLTPEYRDAMQLEVRRAFPELESAFEIVQKAYDIVGKAKFVEPAQKEGEAQSAYTQRVERERRIWQWRQKAAFRELVNLGVMRYWEMKTLPEQGSHVFTCCCKECIDRGGKIMAEMLWALGDGSAESVRQAAYALQGRALLARGRIILAARLEPFLALTQFVSQNDAHTFLMETGKMGNPDVSEDTAVPMRGEEGDVEE